MELWLSHQTSISLLCNRPPNMDSKLTATVSLHQIIMFWVISELELQVLLLELQLCSCNMDFSVALTPGLTTMKKLLQLISLPELDMMSTLEITEEITILTKTQN